MGEKLSRAVGCESQKRGQKSVGPGGVSITEQQIYCFHQRYYDSF